MDREQTFEVVDTPPPDRRDWPSLKDFQEPDETLKKSLHYTIKAETNADLPLC